MGGRALAWGREGQIDRRAAPLRGRVGERETEPAAPAAAAVIAQAVGQRGRPGGAAKSDRNRDPPRFGVLKAE